MYSYRVMVKSVCWRCVHGRLVTISPHQFDSLTFPDATWFYSLFAKFFVHCLYHIQDHDHDHVMLLINVKISMQVLSLYCVP